MKFIKLKNLFCLLAIPLIINSYTSTKANTLNINEVNQTKTEIFKDQYIIGPGDKLKLIIYNLPDLSREMIVLNDGSISIPYIGNINIAGMTLNECNKYLKDLLSKELLQPEAQIEIIEARPIRVSIIGEVNRPGIYTLTNKEFSEGV